MKVEQLYTSDMFYIVFKAWQNDTSTVIENYSLVVICYRIVSYITHSLGDRVTSKPNNYIESHLNPQIELIIVISQQ